MAQADEVQIEHVVPLAYAWDMALGVNARPADGARQPQGTFQHRSPSHCWPIVGVAPLNLVGARSSPRLDGADLIVGL